MADNLILSPAEAQLIANLRQMTKRASNGVCAIAASFPDCEPDQPAAPAIRLVIDNEARHGR